ncbi:hypothetical protein ACFP9V_18305 [Deinococcus radiopugnans]|uniref:hypothetical protein n=1 Tax=Deinococcus radiopugnans TaxID=57497 RepID=UPI00361F93D4
MSLRASLTSAALLSPLVLSAHAQTPAAPLPTDWSSARLSSATYVILDPQLVGPNLLGGSDQTSVLAAMRRDAGGALKRRYPGATISRDAASPQAIRVTPVLQTPGALLPWLKLTARLDFALPGESGSAWDRNSASGASTSISRRPPISCTTSWPCGCPERDVQTVSPFPRTALAPFSHRGAGSPPMGAVCHGIFCT